MSAFVINNPAVGEEKLAGNANLQPSIKQFSWRKKKKWIFIAVSVALVLATVIALLVYFLNKDSAKSTSPQFKGIAVLYHYLDTMSICHPHVTMMPAASDWSDHCGGQNAISV